MTDQFTTFFTASLFAVVQSVLLSMIFLKIIYSANQEFLSFFYISSGKSTTNARLLGGLAISASLLSAVSTILLFYPYTLNQAEKIAYSSALISMLFVTLYGYIDDKYEVRVRFKLSLQLTSIISFAFFNAQNVSEQHPFIAFCGLSILGLALINGTNLLDGLDTLSIKLGTVSSLAFLYLGFVSGSSGVIYLSLIQMSAFGIFYIYNREPAKIYMGEIGGSIIGLIYYVQTTISLTNLKNQMSLTQSLALVFIAGCFPIMELGISFIRRIACKKTPFNGDKLHLHYILKNKYNLSASSTSSRIAISGLGILAFGFVVAQVYNPALALLIVVMITLQCYLKICIAEWETRKENEQLENVFKIFNGKTVNIIDSTQFSSIDISINEIKKTSKKKSA